MKNLTKLQEEQFGKFVKNALKFTAPAIGAGFAQLALGATLEVALVTFALALYGLSADFFKKLK